MTLQFINVVSTKRSGHHAFIQWLQKHSPAPQPHFINNFRIGENLGDVLKRKSNGAQSLIMNLEGVTFGGVASVIEQQQALGAAIKTIIFLRDPLNTAASLIRRKSDPARELVMIIRQLIAQCRLLEICPRISSHKPDKDAPFPVDHVVFYNAWLKKTGHRTAAAETLGLTGNELISAVSQYGGGSSYDNKKEYSDADTARLMDRWRASKSVAVFQSLISHPRLAPVFLEALDGGLTDSFGGTFQDAEGAAYLREASLRHDDTKFVSMFASRLLDREDLFAEIERAGALSKKPFIAKATLIGILGALSAARVRSSAQQ